jgi:WD40 repeat protein
MLEVRRRKSGKPTRWSKKSARRLADILRSRKERFQQYGLVKWLTNLLFGDDVFISYSRRDGTIYAERLAYRLSEEYGYSCRVDLWETLPGREMPEKLVRALRRSRMLVVVASPEAAASPNVGKEIRFYKRAHPGDMHIVPIDFEGTVLGAGWFRFIDGLPPGPGEPRTALASGTPSPEAVQRIGESFGFTRRNRRIMWASLGSLALVLLLFGLGGVAGVYATIKVREAGAAAALASEARGQAEGARQEAQRERAEAQKQRAEAENQRQAALGFKAEADEQSAEAKRQRAEAEKQAGLATAANRQRELAEAGTREARRQEEAARRDAADQQAVAHSRRLATLSERSRSDIDSALLFSAAAYDAHPAPPTVEAKSSLLGAIEGIQQLDLILSGHERGQVSQFVQTPDGRTLITGGQDGKIIFWDLADKRPRPAEGTYGDGAPPRLALTPDGAKLATVGLGHLDLWDVKTQTRRGRVKSPGRERGYYVLAALADSRTVVTNGQQGELVFWDISDLDRPVERHRFKFGGPEYGGQKYIRLAVAAEGTRLAVGGAQGAVALWDVADPQRPRFVREVAAAQGKAVTRLALSPDGESFATADEDGNLLLWDARHFTSQAIQQGPERGVSGLAFGAGGCLLAYANDENEVRTHAVKSPCRGAAVASEMAGRYSRQVLGIALTHDLSHVISGGIDGKVVFWRLGGRPHFLQGELGAQATEAGAFVTRVAYSPDGRLLASASVIDRGENSADERDVVTITDLTNHTRPLPPTLAPGTQIKGLAFSPDGRALASVDTAGAVTLWEAGRGWQPEPLPANATSPGGPVGEGEDGAPSSPYTGKLVAFADGGRTLVTFRGHQAFVLWDLTRRPFSGRTITVPVGAADDDWHVNVMSVAANRDATRLAVGYETGVIYLLDTKEGEAGLVRLPAAHTHAVKQMAFNRDGCWLVSLDANEVGILWDLRGGRPQQSATFYPDGKPGGNSGIRPSTPITFDPFKAISFGSDAATGSETLALSDSHDSVILWDLESRLLVGRLKVEHNGAGLAFSPDGKTLAAGKDNSVRLFDVDFASWARLARRIANREPDAAEKNMMASPAQP